jgi:hypothetical protein
MRSLDKSAALLNNGILKLCLFSRKEHLLHSLSGRSKHHGMGKIRRHYREAGAFLPGSFTIN